MQAGVELIEEVSLYWFNLKVHEKEDISMVDHFSYDQFYVLYVRFLTLDVNKDHMLGKGRHTKKSMMFFVVKPLRLGYPTGPPPPLDLYGSYFFHVKKYHEVFWRKMFFTYFHWLYVFCVYGIIAQLYP